MDMDPKASINVDWWEAHLIWTALRYYRTHQRESAERHKETSKTTGSESLSRTFKGFAEDDERLAEDTAHLMAVMDRAVRDLTAQNKRMEKWAQ